MDIVKCEHLSQTQAVKIGWSCRMSQPKSYKLNDKTPKKGILSNKDEINFRHNFEEMFSSRITGDVPVALQITISRSINWTSHVISW